MQQHWYINGRGRGYLTLETALAAAKRQFPLAQWTERHQLPGAIAVYGTWGRRDENVVSIEFRWAPVGPEAGNVVEDYESR